VAAWLGESRCTFCRDRWQRRDSAHRNCASQLGLCSDRREKSPFRLSWRRHRSRRESRSSTPVASLHTVMNQLRNAESESSTSTITETTTLTTGHGDSGIMHRRWLARRPSKPELSCRPIDDQISACLRAHMRIHRGGPRGRHRRRRRDPWWWRRRGRYARPARDRDRSPCDFRAVARRGALGEHAGRRLIWSS